jgi:cell division protein FtsL
MKKTLIFSLAISLVFGAFLVNNQIKAGKLQRQIDDIELQIDRLTLSEQEFSDLENRFVSAIDIAEFTEELYQCARKTGIRNHEVTTVPLQIHQTVNRGRGRAKFTQLNVNRLQVYLSGSFRKVADYVDRVQKLKQIKRISEISLSPGEKRLNTKIVIDLYAYGAENDGSE